jgi:hypothetical protein
MEFNNNKETPNDVLIERFWERFEDQSMKIAEEYINIYNIAVNYLNSLNNVDASNLLLATNDLSDREYFLLIIKKADIVDQNINEEHFSF